MIKNKLGSLFIILGAVLLLASLSLVLWNNYESSRAEKFANQALSELLEKMPETTVKSSDAKAKKVDEYLSKDDSYVPAIAVDGTLYIGVIYIPSIDTELPVMKDWSYANLDIAPCRYYGSIKHSNLIIAAHNYTSFFDKINKLNPDDEIIFVTADGVSYEYEVIQSELIDGGNSFLMRDNQDNWDLTLFTCTWSGYSRVAVRAVLKDK